MGLYNLPTSPSFYNESLSVIHPAVYLNLSDFHNGTNYNATSLPKPVRNPYAKYRPYSVEQIRASYWIVKIVYPILLLLCTVGNVLTLIVLSRTKHKGSTNGYMCTIAAANLVILWIYFPQYLHTCGLKAYPAFLFPFYNFWGVQNYLTDVFINLSDWVLIVFSLERLLAVTFPLTFRKYQSVKYARILSAVLLIAALLASFYVIFDYYYQYQPQNLQGMPGYDRAPSVAYDHWGVLQKKWEIADGIGKFFLLLIINIIVMVVIKRMQSFNGRKSGDQKRAKAQARNSTVLLMGSVALYLITQSMQVVLNILSLTYYRNIEKEHSKMSRPGDFFMAQPYSKTIQYVNYSVNFLIYVVVSDMFRKQFLDLFGDYKFVRWLRVKRKQWNGKGEPFRKGHLAVTKPRADSVFSCASEISGVEMESRPPSSILPRKVLVNPAAGLQAGMAKLAELSQKSAVIGSHASEENKPEPPADKLPASAALGNYITEPNFENLGKPGAEPLPDIVITSVDLTVSSGPEDFSDSEKEHATGKSEKPSPFRLRGTSPRNSKNSSSSGETSPKMQQKPSQVISDAFPTREESIPNDNLRTAKSPTEFRRGSEPASLEDGSSVGFHNVRRDRGYFDSINRRRLSDNLELKRPVTPVLPGEVVTEL